MKPLQIKNIALLSALLVLMIATRSHHFNSMTHLPDASLAVFLIAGCLLPMEVFPVLLLAAGAADYFAINYAGVSGWCFSPAYWFLIPTYAALFYAGRFYATLHSKTWRALGLFPITATVSIGLAFVISNLSFYLFSGRFNDMTVLQYADSVAQYFLPYLFSAAIYLIPAVLLYTVSSKQATAAQHAG
jgi:hypothetical protein